ncbi:hypothetical protein BVRB_5g098130 isoform A [Beta vulgaris subsp. vulgaris]|uniref:uncharacterized protein LOC104892074 n=1 Tax=Beta vulgaris subsp. vulgaris TaxID=3555 RepID=UPI00053FF929|nr:uncharacterized protein LOC104892074 [Beta vulgaris subsp. vulgaris]KMT12568.1 hypothetical protein BVRB_5g098130 isoform A [Beta vulgaris subsp. vulgaris]
MRNFEAAMLLAIIMLMSMQFMPSSAQQDLPGECWKNIGTCRRNATTAEEFKQECCPVLVKELLNSTDCFCGVKQILDQDPSVADGISQLLTICNIGASFETICSGSAPSPDATTPSAPAPGANLSPMGNPAPAPAPSMHCWDSIRMCIDDNAKKGETMPQFNASSSVFNQTEFLCCPLVQQTSMIAKPCFCDVTTFLQLNPSLTSNVMEIVDGCGVADSVASLNGFCGGGAPNHAPGPMMQPLGSAESLGAKKSQHGAANKMAVAGSLSSLVVLLTYFLF